MELVPAGVAPAGKERVSRDFAVRFTQSAEQLNATLQGRLQLQLLTAATCADEQVPWSVHTLRETADAVSGAGGVPWRFTADAFAEWQRVGTHLMALSGARVLSWDVLLDGEAARNAYEADAAAAAATTADPVLARRLAGGISANMSTGVREAPFAGASYLPLWDTMPPSARGLVGFDVMSAGSSPERRAAIATALATGALSATDLLPSTYAAGAVYAPSTLLYAPGVPLAGTLAPDGSPLTRPFGICVLGFEWASLVEEALPEYAHDIRAVITSASGRTATLTLSVSGVAAVAPANDVHDAAMDAWAHAFDLTLGGDAWRITLYPTKGPFANDAMREYARDTGIIVACVALCGLFFAFYEFVVRGRFGVLLAALMRNLGHVTEMKAAVEAASAAAVRQKDEFVSMVSHEVCACVQRRPPFCLWFADVAPLSVRSARRSTRCRAPACC
jgi:hypothetical protein